MTLQAKNIDHPDEQRSFDRGPGQASRLDDGRERDLGPGDAHVVSPGHDAWVLGDEPCVTIDFIPAGSDAPAIDEGPRFLEMGFGCAQAECAYGGRDLSKPSPKEH
jgi:hypothetical protein